MQMWYYVSFKYADQGVFAKGGGGVGEGGEGVQTEKSSIAWKETLASHFFLFLVLISNCLTVLQRGGGV